jgi:hypothetical protein
VTIFDVNEEAANILETIADGFESGQYGWVRGEFETVEGPKGYCSLGALRHFVYYGQTNVDQFKEVYSIAEHTLRDVIEDRVMREVQKVKDVEHMASGSIIIIFNDQVAEKSDDVVEAMKQAAKNLRNES